MMEDDEKQALEKILSDSARSMKSLHLAHFYETNDLSSEGKIAQILEQTKYPCLERLRVDDCEPTSFHSVLNSAAHTLKYLLLHAVSFPDGILSAISGLNNLRDLYLLNVEVSSDSLNAISDCIRGFMSLQKLRLDLQYMRSDTDKKPEQCKASYNYLLRSVEAKTMLTCLTLLGDYGHQHCVLDLSKHDKLQRLHLRLPLTVLHINTEQLVKCEVYNMSEFSASVVSSLLAELRGAPVLETLRLSIIRNPSPRTDITALPLLTEFTLEWCDLRDRTITLTLPQLSRFSLEWCELGDTTVTLILPRLTKFTLWSCDLRDCTVTFSPEMTSLETITLQEITVSIQRFRELFHGISKLPQPITVKLEKINMTVGEWGELLFNVLGILPKSIHVEMRSCTGPSEEEWRNIFDDAKASQSFCVTSTDYKVCPVLNSSEASSFFDTVVV